MKILILQDDFPPFGSNSVAQVAYKLAKELLKRGHEILVVTTVREEASVGPIELEGLRIHAIKASFSARFHAYASLWNPHVVSELKKVLADFKPDVVHAHNVHSYLTYASLAVAKTSG